jgi:predicted ATPase/DNA-binding SARP family transcriptional activator
MTRLTLRFFGQFQVYLDGTPIVGWRYDKVRALLVYLALENGRSHPRDQLAALLWPDSPDTAARKSLRQALAHLRAAIGDETAVPPFLIISRDAIQFNPASPHSSDVGLFMDLLATCERHPHTAIEQCAECAARLAEAADLYQGDLLPGFALPNNLPFDEWLLTTRERLRLNAIDALGQLGAAYAHSRNDEAALQTARRQLALDPWHEEAYRLLMRLLARRGQRTAALAEYERCRRALAGELGVEPSQETTRLYEQIRQETAVSPIPEPTTLTTPTPLTHLLGREREITAVQTLLRQDATRLLTLLGPPGVGKTRLALQVAQEMEAEFGANRFFVDLAAISDPELVPVAIARSLGFDGEPPGNAATLVRLRRELKEKRALLLLDNFEQVLPAATAVLDLLQSCPHLKILVTSRAPLRLRGEQRYPLPPLPLPDPARPTSLDELAGNPAIALFLARAQAVMPTFSLTDENVAAITAVCHRLDGLPLALELAAARVRLLPPHLLLQRLNNAALHLLQDGAQGAARQQQTLQDAIHWSYNLLHDDHKRLFARLSVFASGFTWEAAEATCQLGHLTLDLFGGLEALLDNSLLQRDESGDYRFAMLQTIREYAQERLAEWGESDLLRQRHADYFLSLAKIAQTGPPIAHQDEWLNSIEQEQDNFRAALAWTIEHSPDQGLKLAVALFPFWHIRARLREGRLWLERALAGETAVAPTRARALAAASLLAQRQGAYGPATDLGEASVALSRQLDDPAALAYALNNLSIVRMFQGENAAAWRMAQESLELAQSVHDPVGINRALMVIGQTALNEDRLAEAQQALADSLAFWRQIGERKNTILCLVNLGRIHLARGELTAVAPLINEAITLSQQLGDRHWEMMATWTLADLRLRQGKLEMAATLWQDCLVQTTELGDSYFRAITLSKLGLLALYRHSPDEADHLLQESLTLARSTGAKWCEADALANQGYAASLRGAYALAETLLRQSLRLFDAQGEMAHTVMVLERLAQVAAAANDPARAAQLWGAATAWRLERGEPLSPHEAALAAQFLATLRPQATKPMPLRQAIELALTT